MDFLYLLNQQEKLSSLPRKGWLQHGILNSETVASHALSVAFLVRTFIPKNLDKEKCLDLAIVHDQAETIIGDITPSDNIRTEDKKEKELKAMQLIAEKLNAPDLIKLFKEYQDQKTPEALFVHDMDRIQALFMALQYDRTNQSREEAFPEFLETTQKQLKTPVGKRVFKSFLAQCKEEIEKTHIKYVRQWGGVVFVKDKILRLAESHEY